MARHEEKLAAALRRLAAEFLNREGDNQSLITVTAAELSADGRRATLLISVLPEEKERMALAFARRRRGDFFRFVRNRLRARQIPQLDFALDQGEKHRQKIDKLIH